MANLTHLIGRAPHNPELLYKRIQAIRAAIRYDRDQRLDDRCHLDIYRIFVFVGVRTPHKLPPTPEMLDRCRLYFEKTQRPDDPRPIPAGAILDAARWDSDLQEHRSDAAWLLRELLRIGIVVMRIYVIWRRRQPHYLNWQDYHRLYALLPERIPADTRLPSRSAFLGNKRAPHAGCPSYVRSHAQCDATRRCALTTWGATCPARKA
jgi:hypothetical protein